MVFSLWLNTLAYLTLSLFIVYLYMETCVGDLYSSNTLELLQIINIT